MRHLAGRMLMSGLMLTVAACGNSGGDGQSPQKDGAVRSSNESPRPSRGLPSAAGVHETLVVAPTPSAEEQKEARTLVEEAIAAHGGADALTRAQTLIRTGSGTMTVIDKTTPFTDEWTWSLPERLRFSIELDKKAHLLLVVNGDKGWQNSGGPTMDIGAVQMRERHTDLYVLWLATLVPLKKEEFILSLLPEIKVNGEPAVGVKAFHKDQPDVKLYFDKKTHLLAKLDRSVKEAGLLVDKEDIYSDYKDFDGVKLPTKQVLLLNGRKYIELTVESYKMQKKIDDTLFAKP